jgi:hypothetical protein
VNVGNPLYKIDVSDAAVVQQSPTPPQKSDVSPPPSPPQPSNSPPVSASAHKTHPRGTPSLIHFVGKREHKKMETSPAPSSVTPSQQSTQSDSKAGIWSPEQMAGYNAAWLGRPTLSIAEIEAIETGGASLTQKF